MLRITQRGIWFSGTIREFKRVAAHLPDVGHITVEELRKRLDDQAEFGAQKVSGLGAQNRPAGMFSGPKR